MRLKDLTLGTLLASGIDPEVSAMAVAALRTLLDGAAETAPLHAWQEAVREQEAAAVADLATRLESVWAIYLRSGAEAHRRDGVALLVGLPSGFDPQAHGLRGLTALIPVGRCWTVTFPQIPGGAPPTTVIQAETLADAMAVTDVRWPCPSWWGDIDAQFGWRG
mgnify:CR=1 FL=1